MYAQLESNELTSMFNHIIRYVLQPYNSMYIIMRARRPFKRRFVFVMNKIALKKMQRIYRSTIIILLTNKIIINNNTCYNRIYCYR